jgi:chromosome segregation ATPase
MSAIEEYRKATRIADEVLSETYAMTLKASTVPREYADAAIAELEAERDAATALMEDFRCQMQRARKRAEKAEAERDKVRETLYAVEDKHLEARKRLDRCTYILGALSMWVGRLRAGADEATAAAAREWDADHGEPVS